LLSGHGELLLLQVSSCSVLRTPPHVWRVWGTSAAWLSLTSVVAHHALLLLPAGAILQFVADTTTRVEGVGDVCSLAVFDFGRHGNSKYGAPAHAPAKRLRSKQVRG
jgi:hypothetical protein